MNKDRAAAIASHNDRLRTQREGGSIVITQSVISIPGFDANILLDELSRYENFNADNDPYEEHDFGRILLWKCEILWKIDYFDLERVYGSDDPADPDVTHRVLTIMLAQDY